MKNNRQCGSSFVGFVWVLIQMLFLFAESFDERRSPVRKIYRHNHEHYLAYPPVQLHIVDDDHIMVDNGILNVSFSISGGMVTGIEYNGIHNLLENENKENNRGYWDVVWTRPDQSEKIDKLGRTRFEVIVQNESQVELSFSRKWDNSSSDDTGLPLNIDKRYIVLRGCSGFYSYAIFERLKGWPAATLYQGRIVFKLQQKLFRYMAISDGKQRIMPTAEDREKGKALDYPEAVLLTNPSNTLLKGEVDDKYQYSSDNKDNRVHGWISQNQPTTGFWMITPSNEFKTAGPIKQDLTSHTGPTTLSMFFSTHYAGESLGIKFANGEPWKKVLGPVFMFVNAVSPNDNPKLLWKNAKKQMIIESSQWPYEFPHSGDHLLANQRGMVRGQLLVKDRYISGRLIYADSAFVGLAPPGLAGSWQTENKGYQFWTRANSIGHFCIPNIRPGTYSLYAWVPGFIGDYKYTVDINIFPGCRIILRTLTYSPPRSGPTLWEIGTPDRTAAEFYIPPPNPTLMNKLYANVPEKYRQYGLWQRYSELYPDQDLVYTVGHNNYPIDWFFAHVNRNMDNNTYVPTTWKIVFNLDSLDSNGNYTLQLALASANAAELQVRINDKDANTPHFTTGLIGKDNTIARHGIHGLYWLYSVNIMPSQLSNGSNTVFLRQSRGQSPWRGIMYDYIRLEAPPAFVEAKCYCYVVPPQLQSQTVRKNHVTYLQSDKNPLK